MLPRGTDEFAASTRFCKQKRHSATGMHHLAASRGRAVPRGIAALGADKIKSQRNELSLRLLRRTLRGCQGTSLRGWRTPAEPVPSLPATSTAAAGIASELRLLRSPPALPSAVPEQAQRSGGLSLPDLSSVSLPSQGDAVRAICRCCSASRHRDPCPPAPDGGGRGKDKCSVRGHPCRCPPLRTR